MLTLINNFQGSSATPKSGEVVFSSEIFIRNPPMPNQNRKKHKQFSLLYPPKSPPTLLSLFLVEYVPH